MNRLIEENLDLVEIIAAQFKTDEFDFEELIGEGRLALVRAAKSFDEERGINFRTYATKVIVNHLVNILEKIRFLSSYSSLRNIPLEQDLEADLINRDLVEKYLSELSSIKREVIRLVFGIGCDALSVKEIVDKLNLSPDKIYKIKHFSLKKIKKKLKEMEEN